MNAADLVLRTIMETIHKAVPSNPDEGATDWAERVSNIAAESKDLQFKLEAERRRCDEISAENRRLREALDKAIHHADRMERADRARLNAETEKEQDEADSAMFDATEDYLIWKEDEALNTTGGRDE